MTDKKTLARLTIDEEKTQPIRINVGYEDNLKNLKIPEHPILTSEEETETFKITDLIKELNQMLQDYGDLPICFWHYDKICMREGSFETFDDFCKVEKSNGQPIVLFGDI